MKKLLLSLGLISALAGCALPITQQDMESEKMTVAKAQAQIKLGMSSSDVVEILGAPNMVTTDHQRRETWVYDKISTTVHAASNSAGVWLLLFGAGGSEGAVKQNQRTLTIIVKFDKNSRVRDFAYRSSSF